ncbi:uncharacterized protein LY89DRAFT_719361 [Mollisia scopiformis]|uniref:GPI anchored serine-threonine rich protein n=1 Tax=Mollisia scopiformis TaxID=149040 RepID=A0A194X6D9_MOLSC|nr:uncharacterized protein LY89DRAFT_719361 [Mollisia scopiformis]KUJ15634.1 hypothetical protein LY89DRAFT_719361 [Mollisia scopiformis]
MYISSVLTISSLAAFAVAATSTTYSYVPTTSACGAQPVLEACIASTTAIIESCAATDYSCQCQKYTDLVTCFNVCPNDPRIVAAQSSQSTYCSDASAYSTTTTSAISRAVSSAVPVTTTDANSASLATTGSSGAIRVASSTTDAGSSASASASSTAKSGAQKELIVGAGSVVMGLAGLVGAFL